MTCLQNESAHCLEYFTITIAHAFLVLVLIISYIESIQWSPCKCLRSENSCSIQVPYPWSTLIFLCIFTILRTKSESWRIYNNAAGTVQEVFPCSCSILWQSPTLWLVPLKVSIRSLCCYCYFKLRAMDLLNVCAYLQVNPWMAEDVDLWTSVSHGELNW